MKKLGILLMTFLFALSVVQGQTQKTEKGKTKETKKESKAERVPLKKLGGTVVNVNAKNNFDLDFGKIPNVIWTRIENFDEAVFTKDGKEMRAYYDSDGKLVGTTQYVTFDKLPEKAKQEIKTKYKEYTVGPVIFYDDNELNETDMVLWSVQFDDEDNYFVELTKGTEKIILRVNPLGNVAFFKTL